MVGVCGKVLGLGRRLAGCRGGLRTGEAFSEHVERPLMVQRCSVVERYVLRGVVFGRRAQAVSQGDVTRSRVGPSLVLFGAPEGAGSLRSSSSEPGRRSEVVNRFHGGVDASPCGPVDEPFGALKRISCSESSSSELGAGLGAPDVSTEARGRSDPTRRLFGARGSDDDWSRLPNGLRSDSRTHHPALRGEAGGQRSVKRFVAPNAGRGGWLNTLKAG